MARRIIVDGIKVEGAAAQRLIDEVQRNVDASGTPRRLVPLSLLLLVAVVVGVVAGITGYVLSRFVKGLSTGWYIAISLVVSFVTTAICTRVHWRFQRRQLREAMWRHGFDLCPKCGYWLKGLAPDRPRCPECGASVEQARTVEHGP